MRAVCVASIFFTLIYTQPALAQKVQRVRVALSTPTPHMAPLWVAKDKKFFDQHGLDVQLILVSGGSLVAQMLASGEIQ
jgi:ABC-type nitrate/sulfonate/bicarbonate transport system substrate-binding protein